MKSGSKRMSIIDNEVTIDGTISSKGSLIIKGTFKGTLVGDSVVIAEEGEVDAEATVTSMTVGGILKGKIRALDELIILSTGNCSGSVVCKDLTIEDGGVLNASVTYIASEDEDPAQEEVLKEKIDI